MAERKRLLALDVLRGITVAGMLLVNNPGTWSNIYAPLRHAEWHGLTPTDLVFPFFMFIMGMSMCFSLKKYDYRLSGQAFVKILVRAIVIFLIGWGIAWLSRFLYRMRTPEEYTVWQAIWNFDKARYLGVLPRLAICYFAASIMALIFKRKYLKWIIAGGLIGYAVLLFVAHGLEFSEQSILYIVDNAVMGKDHVYNDMVGGVRLGLDPEGILSTIPSIMHCLIGYLCGAMLMKANGNAEKALQLLVVGASLTISGFLLAYGIPLNKKIWSPTFVLTTCGLASLLLGLLIWIIDIKGYKRWSEFFEVFGVNPLFLYAFGTVMAILFDQPWIPWSEAETGYMSLHRLMYADILQPLFSWAPEVINGPMLASMLYAIIFVLINWAVGCILYKKKIYIKI